MFLSIGLTSMQAQNYKPLDEAVASVNAALEDLTSEKFVKASVTSAGSGQSSTTSVIPTQNNVASKKIFEVSYFSAFIQQAKLTQNVAEAVAALDAMFQGQQPARTAIITAARADLMELITY